MRRNISLIFITGLFLLNTCKNDELMYNIYRVTLPPLEIEQVTATNVNEIEIIFSEDVNSDSGQDVANYVLINEEAAVEITIISAIKDENNPNIIYLITEGIIGDSVTYLLTVYKLTSEYALRIPEDGISARFTGISSAGVDTSPPNYISPLNNAEFRNSVVYLQWTQRTGANSYYLEIATDSDFNNQVQGSPYTIEKNDYEFNPEENQTYYWRVRADITEAGQYSNVSGQFNRFHTFGDTIYVYCPSGEDCTEHSGVGSIVNPLNSISLAIEKAKQHDIKCIKVAARGNSEEYRQLSVNLANGVSMYGGYTPDFEESTRDITANETIIKGTGGTAPYNCTVNASNITKQTVFDGFNVKGPDTDGSSFGIGIFNSSGSLVISNNTITGGTTVAGIMGGERSGIYTKSSSSVIRDNTIIGDITTAEFIGNSAGIINHYSNPEISNNNISTGNGINRYGILNKYQSNPLISFNTIQVADTGSASDKHGIHNSYDSCSEITGNSIEAYYGIYSEDCNNPLTISDNNITSSQYGIYDNGSVNISIINNTISNNGFNSAIYVSSLGNALISNNNILTVRAGIAGDCIGSANCIFTISNNTITGTGSSGFLGIADSAENTTITNNIIHGSVSISSYQYGVLGNNNTTITQNIIIANVSQTSNSYGIIKGGEITNNIIVSSQANSESIGINLSQTTPSISNNIIFSLATSGTVYGIYEGSHISNYSDPTQLDNNLIFNFLSALYYDYDNGPANFWLDTICTSLDTPGPSGTFGDSDCNPILTTPTGINNITTASGVSEVFVTGFDPADPSTYVIKPNGPADIDKSGGWTEGDLGVNVIECGVQ